MLKKRNLLFLSLFILGILFLSSCFLNPPATEGILKGQVIVPEGSVQTKDLTGQALPDATVNIIDLSTGLIIATTTDANGDYQVFVPAGGPYLLEAVKDEVKLQQITPPVEAGIEYDLGTADCNTTAVALIVQAMLDAGTDLADINLADIESDPNFDDVLSNITGIVEAGGDPTASSVIEQAVEDFLSPPAPTPTPTPTYTVTFDSQGGSAVDSQTVEEGGKATEPTAPTKTGNTFGGWYKESACTNAWDFATDTVTSNATLYAKWTSQTTYSLRDTGPAGGLIFYINPDYIADGWRYLEAAPSDQIDDTQWGCDGTLISGADGTAVGTGKQNTIDIENGCATVGTAADICANLIINSVYDDWFLPSIDELHLMYTNLTAAGVGGFNFSFYWSSSEENPWGAWQHSFPPNWSNTNPIQDYYPKNDEIIWVRAARAF